MMSDSLNQFLKKMTSAEAAPSLDQIKTWLAPVELDAETIGRFSNFNEEHYTRNTIYRNDQFEALLLCFTPGQKTPIHDHAGSACGVKVIQGTGRETRFLRDEYGALHFDGTDVLPQGGVVGSFDEDKHELENESSTEPLMTLHIYAPPLNEVGYYSLEHDHVQTIVPTANEEMALSEVGS